MRVAVRPPRPSLLERSPPCPRTAADEPTFHLVLKDRTFEPARHPGPGQHPHYPHRPQRRARSRRVREQRSLGVEKIISAGREATIKVGPLKPGEYPFENEFNKAASGTLVAVAE